MVEYFLSRDFNWTVYRRTSVALYFGIYLLYIYLDALLRKRNKRFDALFCVRLGASR